MRVSARINATRDLRAILRAEFLTDARKGCRFVGWNANRFDAYYIAAALMVCPDYRIRPYLTGSGALRGMAVTLAEDGDTRTGRRWEFLDGMAMLGLPGMSLDKFLAVFAPDYRKLKGAINWEGGETFDAENPDHVAYAERDSEGLYHAMQRAQSILEAEFQEPLRATIGAACVRIAGRYLPEQLTIDPLPPDALDACREYAMRGGFCYLAKRYAGPVWKYDINQAYAAAMRDGALPGGGAVRFAGAPHPKAKAYMVRLRARNAQNRIPFYCRTMRAGRITSIFALEEIPDTWVTDCEHRQLVAEGWQIECVETYEFSRAFNLRELVDRLERIRTTAADGPSGALGTMIKAVGNNLFGKTAEHQLPIDYLLSADPPDDWEPYFGDGSEPLDHVWFRIEQRRPKAYHQPQIAAAITAHCRMVLRRAALLNPDAWIYADTDCIVFSEDMTAQLPIDPKRYGAFKIEEAGTEYQFIAKKVYRAMDHSTVKAKGLSKPQKLSADDWESWAEGSPPEQTQTQLQTLLAVIYGAEMYREQRRRGTGIRPAINA